MMEPQKTLDPATRDEQLVARLLEEITQRIEAGLPVDLDAYEREYPQHIERIRRAVPALQVLDELGLSAAKGPRSAGSPQSAPLGGTLGDYRILCEIGRGGMGIVYEAEQISLHRRVALKVLPFAAVLDPRHLQRFKNEAQAAASLKHPSIVGIHSVGCERGVHYYAMEYVEGQTLAEVIRQLRGARDQGPGVRDQGSGARDEGLGARGEGLGVATSVATSSQGAGNQGSGARDRGPGARGEGPDASSSIINHQSSIIPPHPVTPSPPPAADTSPLALLSTEGSTRTPEFFRTVARLGIQAAEALDHAHQMGVVHRDIKPSNLMVEFPLPSRSGRGAEPNLPSPFGRGAGGEGRGAEGRVGECPRLWITDFGLARISTPSPLGGEGRGDGPSLTMTGDVLGTLRYMSPEQLQAKHGVLDHRTDIYSLGLTLYELLTLQPAFPGDDRQNLIRQIAEADPRPPRQLNKAIPKDLETIILKATAKEPQSRYATAQQLADDLKRFLADEPIQARRPSLVQRTVKCARRHRAAIVAAACVGLVLLTLGAVAGWNRHQQRTVIERGVGESLAAARAFLQAGDYAAARQELAEAQGQLGGANWKEGPLPAAAQSVADELSARTRAEERFNRFRELQDLTRASMYRSGDLKRLEYCRAALSLYQVLEAADWRTRPEFQDLRAEQRRLVEEGVVELLFALARLQVVTTYTTGDRAEGHRRAIDALRRIETFHEPVPAAYRWMAESWEALGEHKLASAAAQRAAALPARTALDYYVLGDYYLHQNQPEKAPACFAEALSHQPDHFLSFLRSGSCFRLMGRYDLAEAMLTGAIALNPRAAIAYYHRGMSRQSLGKLDLAVADYRKVAELNPQDYLAPYSQAILLRRKGDLAQAVALFDKVLQLNPNSFSSHLHRGFTYADLAQYEKAEADFSRVIEMTTPLVELDRKNWDWKDHLALGYLHRGLVRSRQPGRYRDAVTDADKACASASMFDSANVFLPAGEVFYDAACVYSLASAQAAKDEPEGERERLARRYADRAVDLLRQAIEKGYKDFDHMRQDPDLDPIRQHAGFQELLKAKKDNQQPAPDGGSGRFRAEAQELLGIGEKPQPGKEKPK